ncbi:MAG: stage II sporulation protein M [Candidatus Bathyarchaeales archaeon]
MSLGFWKEASPRNKRIISIITVFAASLIITTAGVLTPVEEHEAIETSNDLEQTINWLKEKNLLLYFIFGNNFMITLIMFIPIIGPLFGGYVFYNTGVVISALATAQNAPPTLVFFLLFLTPVAWLEFLAYSTAIAESIWLVRRILQRRGKNELINASLFISICALLLAVAAVIETVMI